MPSWLAAMQQIFTPILEWIGCARRHVQARQILRLVTVAALDGVDALPVSATPQAEGKMWATILTLQRSVACRVTIDAPSMAEDLERFQKSCPGRGVISWLPRAEGAARQHHQHDAEE
jgi:hypothetical protein